jgi:hypothetical protein
MMARQLIVFVENRPGALDEILEVLADAEVNIDALLLEGSVDFGAARFQVDNPRKAEKALLDAGFQVKTGESLVISLKHAPGELLGITKRLAKAKVNIEALFGTTSKNGESADFVLMVNDIEKARKALES